jgi:acyl-CoA thioester hydrolase
MDFNGHMRNTAYLDAAGDVRLMYFAEHGFPAREFRRLGLGPVILRDELDYFHELQLHDPVDVTLLVAGASEDGSQYILRNVFATADGKAVARVSSTGGWLDLARRRLVVPPPDLLALMRAIPRTQDFELLAGKVRPASAAPEP